jgi:hypothetical protein
MEPKKGLELEALNRREPVGEITSAAKDLLREKL